MNEQPPTSEDESVRTAIDTARSQLSSRRGFLAGSAAAGTLALGASGVGLGFAQDDDTDDESGSDANATVTFDDQMSDGTTVTVESATMSEGGFVAIHDERLLDGKPLESVVGRRLIGHDVGHELLIDQRLVHAGLEVWIVPLKGYVSPFHQ